MADELSFEKALERLEKIVEDLESGGLGLDSALKKYEEGVKLSRACQTKLAGAEKKVEILTRTLDGGLKREPFERAHDQETEAGSSEKKARKKSSKTGGEDRGDFLI